MDRYDKVITELGNSGPVLVMLHGWGQTRKALMPLAETLSKKCKVILFDFPGHGYLKSEAGPYTFERYLDFLKNTISEKVKEPFSLLGWSMGGTIAALYTIFNLSPRPDSLILLSATPKFAVEDKKERFLGQPRASITKMIKMIKENHKLGLESFIRIIFASEESINKEQENWIEQHLMDEKSFPPSKEALISTLKELANTDLTKLASGKALTIPVLLLCGEIDRITPVAAQKLWSLLFTDIKDFRIKNVGHVPQLTALHNIAERIKLFLSSKK